MGLGVVGLLEPTPLWVPRNGCNVRAFILQLSMAHTKGFPGGSAGKESACSAGDLDSIPGLGRSPGGGKGCPLRHSGLENSMDCVVYAVTKSQTRLSDFHFHFQPQGVITGFNPYKLFPSIDLQCGCSV